jgi:asparagine synthase (glutamine-hydrolysing)
METGMVMGSARQAHAAAPDRLNLYRLLTRLGMERVFTPDFLHRVNPLGAVTQPWQIWQHACSEGTPPQENHLPMAHNISSLAGVEIGFPLLDQGLLDFWLALPAEYLHKGQRLRWLFKAALQDLVPEPLLRKRKPAQGLPFGRWLCQHTGLRKLASDGLHAVAERGIVRRDFIHTLLGPQLQQHPGYYGEMAWLLLVLEYWLRAHAPLYRIQA